MDDERRSRLIWLAVGAVCLALLGWRVLGLGGGAGGGDAATRVAVDGAGAPAAAAPARPGRRGARLWIHVAGAVRRPGLYRVRADARVGAAVDRAGGFTRRADLTRINFAATLRDGQQVIVPVRGAAPAPAAPAAPTAPGGAAAPAPAPGAGAVPGAKISLSTATAAQLDGLDGIGPTLAQRIVAWRDAHGGFKSVDQLREVEGIGEKRFEALKAAVVP
jgi:competence protein ComEA